MAGLNNIRVMVVLLVSGTILMLTKPIDAKLPPPPIEPPEPYAGFFQSLIDCSTGILTKDCGFQILSAIFDPEYTHDMPDDCCQQFASIKKKCNDDYVNYIGHGPSFVADMGKYWETYQKVFNKCASKYPKQEL